MYLCGKGDRPVRRAPAAVARRACWPTGRGGQTRTGCGAMVARLAEPASPRPASTLGLHRGASSRRRSRSGPASRAAWVVLQERHVRDGLPGGALPRAARPSAAPRSSARAVRRPGRARRSTDAVAVQGEIRSRLMKAGRPAFVPEAPVSFDDAYRLVLELDGIPCYPTLADGASPVCPWEEPPDALAERLLDRRDPLRRADPEPQPAARSWTRTSRRSVRAGILVMAGTEHNTQRGSRSSPRCARRRRCRRRRPARRSGRAPASWPPTSTCGVRTAGLRRRRGPARPPASPTARRASAGSRSSARSSSRSGRGTARSRSSSRHRPRPDARRRRPHRSGELDELIELARRFGRDPEFSRGGGGNASVKVDGVLYIKPSGVPLATLEAEDLVPLDMEPLLDAPAGRRRPATARPGRRRQATDAVMRVALAARLADAGGRRPSVELLFHALLPERFVLHTHPDRRSTPSPATGRRGRSRARLFGDGVLWVPVHGPGPAPRAAIARRPPGRTSSARAGPAPRDHVMQNHGIIVGGDSAARDRRALGAGWSRRSGRATRSRRHGPASSRATAEPPRSRALARHGAPLVDVIAPTLRGAPGDRRPRSRWSPSTPRRSPRAFTAGPPGAAFVLGGPLTPDQIVYAGSWPLLLDLPADDRTRTPCPTLLRERAGGPRRGARRGADHRGRAAASACSPRATPGTQADTARHIYLDALRVGEGALPARRRAAARRRRAELHRGLGGRGLPARRRRRRRRGRPRSRAGSRSSPAPPRASGSRSPRDLVGAGRRTSSSPTSTRRWRRRTRATLEARYGPGRATAVAMNVMDEQSVADGFHADGRALRRPRPARLERRRAARRRRDDASRSRSSTSSRRVNYRGYFLGVRSAAPIMARQHRGPARLLGRHHRDQLQVGPRRLQPQQRLRGLASSAASGSPSRSPWSSSSDGIKVNAICPGNFFDGPLWSDPENGLFVQYLREGKVPGRHDDRRRPPLLRGQGPDGPRLHAGRRARGPLLPGRPAVRDRPGPAGHRRPGDARAEPHPPHGATARARAVTRRPASAVAAATQHAIQFVGAGQLVHNRAKPVPAPGPDAAPASRSRRSGSASPTPSCCTRSTTHPRKAEVLERPRRRRRSRRSRATCPASCRPSPATRSPGRIVAVGAAVARHAVGERVLVQTDYRHLPTPGSNAAFGYNFEGGLQEYVAPRRADDHRARDGRALPHPRRRGAQRLGRRAARAVGLRRGVVRVAASARRSLPGGRLLVVAEAGPRDRGPRRRCSPPRLPAAVTAVAGRRRPGGGASGRPSVPARRGSPFAADARRAAAGVVRRHRLLRRRRGPDRAAPGTARAARRHRHRARRRPDRAAGRGRRRPHPLRPDALGRHDRRRRRPTATRWRPADGELRAGDRVAVIGAAGPMGFMHVIRAASSGLPGPRAWPRSTSTMRASPTSPASPVPLAAARGVPGGRSSTAGRRRRSPASRYVAVMVPAPPLVAQAVGPRGRPARRVNIFAGFAVGTRAALDLDALLAQGRLPVRHERLRDPRHEGGPRASSSGASWTRTSRSTRSPGMEGVADALAAVEARTSGGKIVVYPALHELGMVRLSELGERVPGRGGRLARRALDPRRRGGAAGRDGGRTGERR